MGELLLVAQALSSEEKLAKRRERVLRDGGPHRRCRRALCGVKEARRVITQNKEVEV